MDVMSILNRDGYSLTLTKIGKSDNTELPKVEEGVTFDSQLQKELVAKGHMVFKSGHPDFLIMHNGELAFVEVKGPSDHLRESQLRYLQALANCGLNTYVAEYKTSGEIKAAKEHGGNPVRHVEYTRIEWAELFAAFGQGIPDEADLSATDCGGYYPVRGPRGKIGMYNPVNSKVEYGHNALRKANVALLGDQRKY